MNDQFSQELIKQLSQISASLGQLAANNADIRDTLNQIQMRMIEIGGELKSATNGSYAISESLEKMILNKLFSQ